MSTDDVALNVTYNYMTMTLLVSTDDVTDNVNMTLFLLKADSLSK